MSAINADTAPAWRDLASRASAQRPSPGCRVEIHGGRKHRGKSGVVLRHQVSRYGDPFRYTSDAQAVLREMEGRFGFVVLVQADDDSVPFWINAEHTNVIKESAS